MKKLYKPKLKFEYKTLTDFLIAIDVADTNYFMVKMPNGEKIIYKIEKIKDKR